MLSVISRCLLSFHHPYTVPAILSPVRKPAINYPGQRVIMLTCRQLITPNYVFTVIVHAVLIVTAHATGLQMFVLLPPYQLGF